MSFARYFRIALAFPLLGACLSLLAPPPYGFLALGLAAYGVPYGIFAIGVGVWSIHRSEPALRIATRLLPALFLVVLLLFDLSTGDGVDPGAPTAALSVLSDFAAIGPLALLVGYAYVAFSWVLWALVSKIGGLRKDADR